MLSHELVEKVYDYLDEKVGLGELEEWLVPRLPVFLSNFGLTAEADLVATLEHGLAEISSNVLTEDAFRQEIKDYLHARDLTVFSNYPETQSITRTEASYEAIAGVFSDYPWGPVPVTIR